MLGSFLKRINIRTRLLILCFAAALPLLLIGTFSIGKQYQILHNEAQRATTTQAAIAVRVLSRWISAQEDGLKSLASVPDIYELNLGACQQILCMAQKTQADWNNLAILDIKGQTLACSSTLSKFEDGELCHQKFFKDILATGKPAISGYVHCLSFNKFAILAGAPIIDNGSVRAVLIASIDPNAILKLFAGLDDNSGSVISVIDEKNIVLTRTLNNDNWVGKDFSKAKTVRAAKTVEHGTLEAVGIADPISRTYAFARVASTSWLVIVGIPTAIIYGPAHNWLIAMFTLAISGIGFSVFFAYLATGHFTKPINQLVREALAIGRGDLQKRVNVTSADEFGLLARAFNSMAENLQITQEHNLMVETISESIRRSLELEQILNTAVSELGQALSASRCCLALLDSQSSAASPVNELVFEYLWSNPKMKDAYLAHRRLLLKEGSILEMLIRQRSIMSIDLLDDSVFAGLFDSKQEFPKDWQAVKSMIACPIIANEQILGVVLVHQCNTHRLWSNLELELVEAIASHIALATEHATVFEQMKTLAERELLINNIVRSVRSSLDLETILNTVTKELGSALKVDRCQIGQPSPDGPLIVSHEFTSPGLPSMKGTSLYPETLSFQPSNDSPNHFKTVLGINLAQLKEISSGHENLASQETPIAVIANTASDPNAKCFKVFLEAIGSRSLICAPLLDNQRLIGVLMVHQCLADRTWKPHEISLVAAIADQVAIAIRHAQLFAQVKYQAITDGLTSLYNHVYLKKRLNEELRRAKRKGSTCSLLMIDLDKLKQINDNYGHPVGDAAIRQVAAVLKTLLRSSDTAARYGGEEFAVILPETDLSESVLIANRLCRQINVSPVPGLGQISVSIGAATFPSQADSLELLIEKADKALYSAKYTGRNKVCVWQDDLAENDLMPLTPKASLQPALQDKATSHTEDF